MERPYLGSTTNFTARELHLPRGQFQRLLTRTINAQLDGTTIAALFDVSRDSNEGPKLLRPRTKPRKSAIQSESKAAPTAA